MKKAPNAVRVIEVTDSAVLDLEPVGDNGPALCFFVEPEKVLLLVGQWLLEYPSFPSATFRLHLRADSGDPIRIEVTGETVSPIHSTVRLKPTMKIKRVSMLRAKPETLQSDLESALTKQRQDEFV